jgi:hypothetical protein
MAETLRLLLVQAEADMFAVSPGAARTTCDQLRTLRAAEVRAVCSEAFGYPVTGSREDCVMRVSRALIGARTTYESQNV